MLFVLQSKFSQDSRAIRGAVALGFTHTGNEVVRDLSYGSKNCLVQVLAITRWSFLQKQTYLFPYKWVGHVSQHRILRKECNAGGGDTGGQGGLQPLHFFFRGGRVPPLFSQL